jgi:copper homeostasis protein
MEAAQGRNVTLHRCFDVCRDPFEALEQAVSLGIHTILTSGQASSAPQGAELLKKLRCQSGGRIHLMAGAGVSAKNIPDLHAKTGITHFHLSGKKSEPGPMVFRREGVPMGLPGLDEWHIQQTDPAAVQAARIAMDE